MKLPVIKISFKNWETWYCQILGHEITASNQASRIPKMDLGLEIRSDRLTWQTSHTAQSTPVTQLAQSSARISLPRKWKSDAEALISHHATWQKNSWPALNVWCYCKGFIVPTYTHKKKANKSKQKKNPKITRQYKITTTQKFTDHSCMNLSCRPSMHSETRIWTAGIRHYYNLCITKQRNKTKKNTCIVLKMRELWQNSVCIDKQFSGRKFLRKWEKVNLKKKKDTCSEPMGLELLHSQVISR